MEPEKPCSSATTQGTRGQQRVQKIDQKAAAKQRKADDALEAEKKVTRAVIAAATVVAANRPTSKFLVFHALKYGITGEEKLESDIDVVLVYYDEERGWLLSGQNPRIMSNFGSYVDQILNFPGALAMILFEVKSATTKGNVFRNNDKDFNNSTSRQAALQTMTHLWMLNRELKLGLDWLPRSRRIDWVQGVEWQNLKDCWVKLCVVFPDYLGNDTDRTAFEDLAERMFVRGSGNIRFLTKNDVENFSSQLETMLDAADVAQPASRVPPKGEEMSPSRLFHKVAVWCLLQTFGLVLSQRSQKMDEELRQALSTTPDRAGALSTSSRQKTRIALLTEKQRFILNPENDQDKPVLIVGDSGTGKTFLLLAKLRQLQEENLLTETAKALVIIEERQVFMRMFLEDTLGSEFGGIVTLRSAKQSSRPLGGVLDVLNEEREHVKYLFVDQVEDYLHRDTDLMDALLPFCEHKQLQLMWFLYNGRFRGPFLLVPGDTSKTLSEKGGSWFHCSAVPQHFKRLPRFLRKSVKFTSCDLQK
jgi:hypothetical protein